MAIEYVDLTVKCEYCNRKKDEFYCTRCKRKLCNRCFKGLRCVHGECR